MSVAGRIALPGERIDNGLDEGQLNGLGIGALICSAPRGVSSAKGSSVKQEKRRAPAVPTIST